MYNVQGCDCSIRLVRAGFDALALAALQRESAASPLSTTTTIARKKLTQIIHEGMNAWRGELRGSLAGREAFIAVAMNDERTGKMTANRPPGSMQARRAA